MKYWVEDENGYVVREFRTWRDVMKELRGNHYTGGSYSMCLVQGTRLFGLKKPTGHRLQDSTPVYQITRWIDSEQYNGTNDYTLRSFYHYWANTII